MSIQSVEFVDETGKSRTVDAPNYPVEVLLALLCGAALFVGLGAIVFRWAPDGRVGLTFLIFGTAVATTLVSIPAGRAGYGLAFFLSAASATVATSSFLALPLLFPRPLSRATLTIKVVATLTFALSWVIALFSATSTPFPPSLDVALWSWVAAGLLGGLVILSVRARDVQDRQSLSPIVYGAAAGIAPLVLLDAVPFVLAHTQLVPNTITAVGLIGIPIGFAYAILRHRLFALDALLRRLLLRTIDIATFAVIFVLAWLPLNQLGLDEPIDGLTSVFVAALICPTLTVRLRNFVDALFYGPIYRARSWTSFDEERSVQDLGAAITRQIRDLVPVRWIGFTPRPLPTAESPADSEAHPAVLVAADGDVPLQRVRGKWTDKRVVLAEDATDVTVVPVVSGKSTVGALVVGPRLNNSALNGLDLETIRLLARQASPSIEASLLREQAEDERRFRDGLSELARELAAAGSADQVLQITGCHANRLLRSDLGLIWLRDAKGRLSLVARQERGDEVDDGAPKVGPAVVTEDGEVARLFDLPAVVRERQSLDPAGNTISRIVFRLGDADEVAAFAMLIRRSVDNPFTVEDERRAREIVEHANGAFRRAYAVAQAAEAETLRQITQVRSEFLDVVSHDLQNPLSVIRGFAELLDMRLAGADDEFVNNCILSIVQATNNCQRLIDDLLTSSRIERGRLALRREAVDLGSFLERLARGYQVLPDGHRIVVETAESVKTSADVARLEQMVGNLVTNALRYAPEGPIRLRARRLSLDEVCVEVQDRGKGIAPEDQDKIWDRFYRTASGSLRASRGAGVGLWVVRTLADLHGGRTEVESALGQGSLFRIVLPIADTLPRGQTGDATEQSAAIQ